MTLADLALQTQDRLEEFRDLQGTFWSVPNEIYPAIVEGMNEAALITGEPELRTSNVVLQPGGNVPGFPPFVYSLSALFPPALILIRVDAVGGGTVKKLFAVDLDRDNPTWESDTGMFIKRWFPLGMTFFGVYPMLTVPQQVQVTVLGFPIPTGQPYSGAEVSPFRQEYNDAFHEYAHHVCRLKESGPDFQESLPAYQAWVDKMVQLTKFAARRGLTRFYRLGRQVKINEVVLKS
jgi:hypothetical protein